MSTENANANEALVGRAALAAVEVTPSGRGRRPNAQTVRARRAVVRHLTGLEDNSAEITARSVASATRTGRAHVAQALRFLHGQNVLAVTGSYIPESAAGRGKTQAGTEDRRQRPELIYTFAAQDQS